MAIRNGISTCSFPPYLQESEYYRLILITTTGLMMDSSKWLSHIFMPSWTAPKPSTAMFRTISSSLGTGQPSSPPPATQPIPASNPGPVKAPAQTTSSANPTATRQWRMQSSSSPFSNLREQSKSHQTARANHSTHKPERILPSRHGNRQIVVLPGSRRSDGP